MQASDRGSTAETLRRLTVAFGEFEGLLDQTPLIRRLTGGRFELSHYQAFLVAHRQQVKDGALWMARAASNIDVGHMELRSLLLKHAVTEHRDFRLLEDDYAATGGDRRVIETAEPGVGSEALSAWMFHEASRPNPFGLLGAMWIIEGLGSIKAAEWGRLVMKRLGLPGDAVRFLTYHGENDAEHIEEFRGMLDMVLPDPAVADRIVKCARVTARLYALQVEEITA